MTKKPTTIREEIDRRLQVVKSESGFGEVIIKIKNGVAYRVLHTVDTIWDEEELDKR